MYYLKPTSPALPGLLEPPKEKIHHANIQRNSETNKWVLDDDIPLTCVLCSLVLSMFVGLFTNVFQQMYAVRNITASK